MHHLQLRRRGGGTFLAGFQRARVAMRDSEAAMLRCAEAASTPEHRAQYAATHKQMVKLRRQWNQLEASREAHPITEDRAI